MTIHEPLCLLLLVPAAAAVLYAHLRSTHPMPLRRRRILLALRLTLVVLAVLALADLSRTTSSLHRSVLFLIDHSASLAEAGTRQACEWATNLARPLPSDCSTGALAFARTVKPLQLPGQWNPPLLPDAPFQEEQGEQSDLAQAVSVARGFFPPDSARRIVLLTDGVQTAGDVRTAVREAAAQGIRVDVVPIAGPQRQDVRLLRLRPNRMRSHEGASITLSADIDSTLAGTGTIRLYENGVEVASQPLTVKSGEEKSVEFQRTPDSRNLYRYSARLEGFAGDAIAANNQAPALVDVRGRPLLLYIESDPAETRCLNDAMTREGIRLEVRPPEGIPESIQELAGYDGVIFSDIPAHRISAAALAAVRDYVRDLGGGFLMLGGPNSFGAGGYFRTPIEDILPVRIRPPDTEENFTTALMLVIDRSGSMGGGKLELCKSAASACAELMSSKDYFGVVAFDSAAFRVSPLARCDNKSEIMARIQSIDCGGGTNIEPGMNEGRAQLAQVSAKVKHMIVLTDGQTMGGNYPELAAQIRREGVTISTIAVGGDADTNLLQAIAAAGEGKFYVTFDPSNLPRIFVHDAMTHMGKLLREQSFQPRQAERHPMLKGWNIADAPPLLGYVRTLARPTAQTPLVTDAGDPLLANWRYGLGKVTIFASDCKTRWGALWVNSWPQGYSQFWAQVLRETARPPQGNLMDIQVREENGKAVVTVDCLENAAEYRNGLNVDADVFFVPAAAQGGGMKHLARIPLPQSGIGRYEGSFLPQDAGTYLVRARAGSQTVSAGLIHNTAPEAATGHIDRPLLEELARLGGGNVLSDKQATLADMNSAGSREMDLTPLFLKLLLLLSLADLALRRWDHVEGLLDWLRTRLASRASR